MTGPEFGEVDIDVLADYIGGALTGTPEEAAVAALIADDPAWRTTYESLAVGMAAVGAELGQLDPEPMPADVVARLDAALESSITSRPGHDTDTRRVDEAATLPQLVPVPGEAQRVRERKARAPRGPRRRWAAPIAIAAGLIAFVGFGADYLVGRTQTDKPAESVAAQPDIASPHREPAAAGGVPYDGMATTGTPMLLSSGTDYTAENLATLVILPPAATAAPAETGQTASPYRAEAKRDASRYRAEDADSLLDQLAPPVGLDNCLHAIERENAHGTITVQSVDYARYTGHPAVIVRFTAANGRWAWASGPACGTPSAGAATLHTAQVR